MATEKGATNEKTAFKNWFDHAAAKELGQQFARVHSTFDRHRFVRLATRNLDELELQARIKQFADAMAATLPDSIPEALQILTQSLPPARPDCASVTDSYLQWPLGQFIADYGLEHFDESFEAMIELTQRFSSEFAVRPFVERYPAESFARFYSLSTHPNPHVRRWCSEGSRPLLPWGRKLHALVADPRPIWSILDTLIDDEELYVRRSVANNLNDIAKHHPDEVVKWCAGWQNEENQQRTWLIKHALRSLIKDGHPGALALLGFGPPQKLTAALHIAPKHISIGETVEMTAHLTSGHGQKQNLIIDYAVHYVRKGGKTSVKVFKWTTGEIPARGNLSKSKKHGMKITTIRALYPGVHRVALQVNGVPVAESRFELR